MLLEKTRNAMAIDIVLALQFPKTENEDVLAVKTARKIFHAEWSDEDILTMCKHIRKSGTADLYWPNNTEWIFKQIYNLAFYKATDYQVVEWLKGIWGADRTLDYIISCEQEFLKDGVAND